MCGRIMSDNTPAMDDRSYPNEPERSSNSSGVARSRASALSFFLLVCSIVLAAVGMLDGVGQQWADILKVAAVALFVGVFPANVNMCRLWWGKPWPMRIIALARLPLQIPMITTALKIRRDS